MNNLTMNQNEKYFMQASSAHLKDPTAGITKVCKVEECSCL